MTDLLNRANVDIAINTLLDDLQPNDAIQPSDHNGLLKDILDTLSNGLSTTLRTGNTTGGFDIDITDGDNIQYNKGGSFVGVLDSLTLTGSRSWDFPDNSGTIALLSDITGGDNLATADLTQTDLQRTYTRSSAVGVSKLRFRGASSSYQFEDAGPISLYTGDADVVPYPGVSLSSGGGNTGEISFRGGKASIQGAGSSLYLKGIADNSTFVSLIQLDTDILINPNNFRTLTIASDNTVFKNSDNNAFYGNIDDDVFIWSSQSTLPAVIGSEKFSIQEDTLIKGSNNSASTSGFKVTDVNNVSLLDIKNSGQINMGSLPTSSAGLSSGDIWNNSGVLNIV